MFDKEIFRPMKKAINWWIGCILTVVLGAGCDENTVSKPEDIVFPDSSVSFQRHVLPFFQLTCAYAGCHDDQTQAGGIALTSYFNLWTKPGLIIPGDPDNSVLVQILEGRLPHPPSFQARVTQNHIRGIRQWIAEGAKNN